MRPLRAAPPAMSIIQFPARVRTARRQDGSNLALWQRPARAAPKGCALQQGRHRWCLQAAGKDEARSAAAEKGPSSSSIGTEVKPEVPDAALGPSTSSRTEVAPAAPVENVEDAMEVLQAARRGAVQVGRTPRLCQLLSPALPALAGWLSARVCSAEPADGGGDSPAGHAEKGAGQGAEHGLLGGTVSAVHACPSCRGPAKPLACC